MTLKAKTKIVATNAACAVLFTFGLSHAQEKELGFRFNWAVGTKATVVTTAEKHRELGGKQPENSSSTSRFTLAVEKAENNHLAIVYDMKALPQVTGPDTGSGLQSWK